jgi:hypothetical protein
MIAINQHHREEGSIVPQPTSKITVVETEHGRLRRKQRGIDKKDLQTALKYGERETGHPRPNGDPTAKYTYNDIVYIVNECTKEEVTSYAMPFPLDKVVISPAMEKEHRQAQKRLKHDLDSWKSNTVIVVDTSGSMRAADVWGARDRLKAVWMSIALDFIAHRIETCEASPLDVVSIVTLGPLPEVVIEEQPCTFVLYNAVVDIYNQQEIVPRGHGPFIPALQTAKELLLKNPSQSCALSLSLFTDGAPSDFWLGSKPKCEYHDDITKMISELAEIHGSRLSFTVVAIGDKQDFTLLNKMVQQAKEYRSKAFLMLPSMSLSDLGTAVSSISTSITQSQIEMTNNDTLIQRTDRNVSRETLSKAAQKIKYVDPATFQIFPLKQVRRTVYKEWLVDRKRHSTFESMSPQHPDAAFVAVCRKSFGEGGERFAFRFYEVASDGRTIVGNPLVAKESRHVLEVEEGGNKRHENNARIRFVKRFCSGQQLAARLAEEFNQNLNHLYRVHPATPRISFLDCSVYELETELDGDKQSVLVEERLDEAKWHKWNTNNGYVDGMTCAPVLSADQLRDAMTKQSQLDLIAEDDEDEDNDEDVGKIYDRNASYDLNFVQVRGKKAAIIFTPSEVAQAYSHFTHTASGKKRLVCDLQGVYDEDKNVLRLSDPVIHYHNDFNREGNIQRYGNTDRGRKGMAMFFATHHCGHLCKLILRGMRQPREQFHVKHNLR